MVGEEGEPFLNLGQMEESFHSLGNVWRSRRERKRTDKGKAREEERLLKRIGGRWSGPEEEEVLSLRRTLYTIEGVISMSAIPEGGVLILEGKGGRRPLSLVKADLKYWLSSSALSESEERRKPAELRRGGIPEGELSLELTNL